MSSLKKIARIYYVKSHKTINSKSSQGKLLSIDKKEIENFMKVAQRINEILKEKNISKRELAKRLINLDMKASRTGEIPTESSIYAYLNGNIEIKADMLPFIADALGVFEQEFFCNDKNQNDKILKRLYNDNELSCKYKDIIIWYHYTI